MTNIGKKITTLLLAAPLVVNLGYPRAVKTAPEPPFTKKNFDTIQSDLQKTTWSSSPWRQRFTIEPIRSKR